MVTDVAVRESIPIDGGAVHPWWMGIFEKVLAEYATSLAAERPVIATDRMVSLEPGPLLAWFPAVMENLARLP